jgi:hypothetical protein
MQHTRTRAKNDDHKNRANRRTAKRRSYAQTMLLREGAAATRCTWTCAIDPQAGRRAPPPLARSAIVPNHGGQRSASLGLLLGILGQCSIHGEGRTRGHGHLCGKRGGSAFGWWQASAGWLSRGCARGARRQTMAQAAPSSGQPRPVSRLGRACRPNRRPPQSSGRGGL